jgi:hypothetical protein
LPLARWGVTLTYDLGPDEYRVKPKTPKTPPRPKPVPRPPILRAIVLGGLGVALSVAWAVHHFTHTRPPLRVPAPPAPTYDADAGEMPVPEVEDGR